MIPKRCENDPNTMRKWSQHDAKMIPKRCENDPNTMRRWSQNDAKMIPKSSQNRRPPPPQKTKWSIIKTITNIKKRQQILTPGIRRSLDGGLFWGYVFFVFAFFLKILTRGIRRSLGGGLLGDMVAFLCFLCCFSLKYWPGASGEA